MNPPFYNHSNTRSTEQAEDMRALEELGICLFCSEHLRGDPNHHILHQTRAWVVTENRFPYPGTKIHLLLIPVEHVSDIIDLSAEARADFWDVLGWCRARWELSFYGLGVRCGDFHFTGGTLEHLHVHLVVGDVFDEEHEPIRMKLSSRATSLEGEVRT
jgi:ATP adenylyltransferase